ncbi:MAG: hypothetical protein R2939_19295 [Kofleriaceae bacterium]
MSTIAPDVAALQSLGEQTIQLANAWAGARDPLTRGLKEWIKPVVAGDRVAAVRAALAACELVAARYPTPAPAGLPGRSYIDGMLAVIRRWLDDPSEKQASLVRSTLDVSRDAHAWQRERAGAPAWILEAVDHASLAIWAGHESSYIMPMGFATSTARACTCVLHAMLEDGVAEADAVAAVTKVVLTARG